LFFPVGCLCLSAHIYPFGKGGSLDQPFISNIRRTSSPFQDIERQFLRGGFQVFLRRAC
jgi:hypothetical protein